MLWELRVARDKFSIEAAVEKGRDLPQWYIEEPPLEPGDDFYLRAFRDLHTCRSIGMGTGPIPWRDIVDYAYFHQLDEDLIGPFISVIREMDQTYMDWDSKEREREMNKRKK